MANATTRVVKTDRGDAGRRLDLVLRRHLSDVQTATRTRIQSWIRDGLIDVNGSVVRRAAARAACGDVVRVALPDQPSRRPMTPEQRSLDILFEDEHLLAVNKPAGLVVHPGYRNAEGTLLNALLWQASRWLPGQRPSIVGRLDKLTSGLVLVAKTRAAHRALQLAMTSSDTRKDYLAVVYGRVADARGYIALRLARHPDDRRRVVASDTRGAPSMTRFERLARVAAPRAGLALLRCRLGTGRMHQIRVHLASRGWPLVGDPTYGETRWTQVDDPVLAAMLRGFERQALHAWQLETRHPFSSQRLTIEAPLPEDLAELLTGSGLFIPRLHATAPTRATPTISSA
jgi:23S rRNA pseudouridine1911/1915/1917 synthase